MSHQEALAAYDQLFSGLIKSNEPYNQVESAWEELKAPYASLYDSKDLGDEVGPGWWPLLLEAFAVIKAVVDPHPGYRFTVRQIKEKFGGLRFYYHLHKDGEDEEEIRFGDEEEEQNEVRMRLHQQIGAIIDAAEVKAAHTCEVCGEPGEQRATGWIKTLCERHHEVMVERNRKRGR